MTVDELAELIVLLIRTHSSSLTAELLRDEGDGVIRVDHPESGDLFVVSAEEYC